MTSKDILQADFLKFVWFVWTRVLGLPVPTRIQLDIARFISDSSFRRRFIQAFRGVGKTFLIATYVVWRLWKDPNEKVMVVSANETFATEIATFIKQIIDSPAADGLWSELRSKPSQRSSTMAFDVGPAVADKSPSVKAVGIFGQLTGSRASILISDDVEVPKNAETEGMREKLEQRTTEYAAILKPGGEIIYLGTPQTQQSIYRKLPEKGYAVRIWTARYPATDRLDAYLGHLAPLLLADIESDPNLLGQPKSIGGAPTDPARFSELELQERETEYRMAGFLLQYQLDTSLSDADKYPLKTRDLVVMDVDAKLGPVRLAWGAGADQHLKDMENVGFDGDRLCRPMFISPDFVPFTGSVMHIDPSGRGRDQTTYCVTKFLNGFVYVAAWGGFQDGYGEATLKGLADISAEHEVNLICPEDNFGDGMFGKLLEPVVARRRPCPIEGHKVSGAKEERMVSTLEPVIRQHRLVLDTTVARIDLKRPDSIRRGLYQLTHLTRQRGALKHDDMVDVLSHAVAYWAPRMNVDASAAEAAHQRKQEAEWERQFFSGVILGGPAGPPKGARRMPTGRDMRGPSRYRRGF